MEKQVLFGGMKYTFAPHHQPYPKYELNTLIGKYFFIFAMASSFA